MSGCSVALETGVSGGGGEPRWARVVDVDAVELSLLRALSGGASRFCAAAVAAAAAAFPGPGPLEACGGGQYCC